MWQGVLVYILVGIAVIYWVVKDELEFIQPMTFAIAVMAWGPIVLVSVYKAIKEQRS